MLQAGDERHNTILVSREREKVLREREKVSRERVKVPRKGMVEGGMQLKKIFEVEPILSSNIVQSRLCLHFNST